MCVCVRGEGVLGVFEGEASDRGGKGRMRRLRGRGAVLSQTRSPTPARGGPGGGAGVPRMFRGLPRGARRLWQTLTHPPARSRAVI